MPAVGLNESPKSVITTKPARFLRFYQFPKKSFWDELVAVFFEEVNILYPLVHRTSFFEQYNMFWNNIESRKAEFDMTVLPIIYLCIALGLCTRPLSPESFSGDFTEPPGWPEFIEARRILEEHIWDDFSEDSDRSLNMLQGLIMCAVYVFRVERSEMAQKFISLAACHAFDLGIHQKSTYDSVTHFNAEMYRRAWWSLYTIDRRVAFSLGRPHCIQDNATDTDFPKFYNDDEFNRNAPAPAPCLRLSLVPFLVHHTAFCRIMGCIYDKVYSANSPPIISESLINELEGLIFRFQQELPSFLRFNMNSQHTDSQPLWIVKQRVFLHIVRNNSY